MTNDTAALREMLALATPGPWEVDGACCSLHGTETRAIYHVEESMAGRYIQEVVEAGCGCHHQVMGEVDAALIAAAVNALPTLLDNTDRLAALEAGMRGLVEEWKGESNQVIQDDGRDVAAVMLADCLAACADELSALLNRPADGGE